MSKVQVERSRLPRTSTYTESIRRPLDRIGKLDGSEVRTQGPRDVKSRSLMSNGLHGNAPWRGK